LLLHLAHPGDICSLESVPRHKHLIGLSLHGGGWGADFHWP
jgi:hypothetical protein